MVGLDVADFALWSASAFGISACTFVDPDRGIDISVVGLDDGTWEFALVLVCWFTLLCCTSTVVMVVTSVSVSSVGGAAVMCMSTVLDW